MNSSAAKKPLAKGYAAGGKVDMPLIKSGSRNAIGANISEMEAAGHPRAQSIAAALSTARRYAKRAFGGRTGYATGGQTPPIADPLDLAGKIADSNITNEIAQGAKVATGGRINGQDQALKLAQSYSGKGRRGFAPGGEATDTSAKQVDTAKSNAQRDVPTEIVDPRALAVSDLVHYYKNIAPALLGGEPTPYESPEDRNARHAQQGSGSFNDFLHQAPQAISALPATRGILAPLALSTALSTPATIHDAMAAPPAASLPGLPPELNAEYGKLSAKVRRGKFSSFDDEDQTKADGRRYPPAEPQMAALIAVAGGGNAPGY